METKSAENKKVYVDVLASFSKDGRLKPVELIWENGQRYKIDRINNIRRAATKKAGGCGIQYTCMINGIESHLYYEENYKWFVERRMD